MAKGFATQSIANGWVKRMKLISHTVICDILPFFQTKHRNMRYDTSDWKFHICKSKERTNYKMFHSLERKLSFTHKISLQQINTETGHRKQPSEH